MDRGRVAGGPGQRALALALAHQNHRQQKQGSHRGCDDRGDLQTKGHQQHAGGRGRRAPAGRLAETHERVEAALFPDRRQVDRHAIGRHVLGRGKAVDQRADQHQQPDLLGRTLDQHEREQRHRQTELRTDHPGPPPAHRQELVAVHQRPGEQLEGPGQDDDGQIRANIGGASAQAGQPRGNRNGQQPLRNTLREVHHRAGRVAHACTVCKVESGRH